MFGRFKRNKIRLDVKFHTDVNNMQAHGTFWADHKTLGLINFPVSFAFVGVDTPPKLDRALFNYILDKAEAAGFVVHGLRTYAGMFQPQAGKVSMEQVRQMVQSAPNKQALDLHYATERARNTQTPQRVGNNTMVMPDGKVIRDQVLPEKPQPTLAVNDGFRQVQILGGGFREKAEPEVMDMSGLLGVTNTR